MVLLGFREVENLFVNLAEHTYLLSNNIAQNRVVWELA